ncbi:arylamine N-acetyltransferase [Streptomyces sp. UNOC14_S4]|uniref:arylamine N-acetyltransferase family protein n=1 Tax=Streptomyces sp. UNOC14_S4 TaxID=2872340 RepID=UPI001E4D4F4F|nr:arylamine N-acetyltransferase [Streptomyces sp. UNOC14_S4]MCC3769101.1 arylamine N-acetyltransferase [Streptomyces sp. UNOC14_S4]
MSELVWGGDELDLGAYMRRIGFEGQARLDGATLRALHRAHVAAFPFENLEILLGRPVRLDVAALQAKMVAVPRGGYCHEQNLLLAAVLERLGFSVTGIGARVRNGSAKPRPVTHFALAVELDGGRWLCDVGFGGEGLLEPLPLADGVRVRQGGWTFGIVREPTGLHVLRSLHPDGWFDLYTFGEEPRFPADCAVMNHYTATHPGSPFVSRAVVQRTEPGVRRSLVGSSFSVARSNGTVERHEVKCQEVAALLEREFGIELTEADAGTLARVYSSGS